MNRSWVYLLHLSVCYRYIIACKKNALDHDSFLKPGRIYDMAIEGGFNTLTTSQYIRLTKPALHPDSLPSPVRKATVMINDSKSDIDF